MDHENFSHQIKEWFFLSRRSLPWRENPSPYEVWVSEVMLQQTQVSVVVPYFKRWMERFPSVTDLAEAPQDKVIKTWEGLGYYSRARNLHEGAKYLVKHHGGELPDSYEELKKVKGLGPYTIGAILSFAFNQKAPAVDGNVLRVLARYFCIEEEIDRSTTRKKIEGLTRDLLPDVEPWVVMEALIELGALVCQKKPQCTFCPLKTSCLAHLNCKADLLPKKSKRTPTIHLHRTVAVIHSGEALLLKKGEEGKVMADLWEFPYFDRGVDIGKEIGLNLTHVESLKEVTHGFTRYKAFLYPELYHAKELVLENHHWVPYEEVKQKAFSSGHRRILEELKSRKLFADL